MAFVGPRPLLPETIAALAMHGVQRGAVRPGLTGWSQVNGNTLLALEEKIALDLWYVAHSSPLLDLRILLLTVWVMVGGERRAQGDLLLAEPDRP
jgi:lipopolysaccharide/colanic/teichoic acid biosynthesis glycosyltransferase